METALLWLFWLSLVGLGHAYLGYPAGILLISRFRRNPTRLAIEGTTSKLPEITVLIAAHNAEQHIRQRIDNLLACDYPAHKLQILVASDGSADATPAIVRELLNPRVRVIHFADRRGKSATLTAAVGHIQTEVVLFTDVTTLFERSAIANLAVHFEDPQVGLVTGHAAIVDQRGKATESLYWRSENLVRRAEAKLGIMLGASGAIYALRRNLFVAPSRPIINDDLVLPMLTHLRHGCKFVNEPTAIAYALSSGGVSGEFHRRCRIGAGAYQCLPVLREMLHWKHLTQVLAFTSHKLLRWLSPFFLVGLLFASFYLSSYSGFFWFLCAQASGYLLAICGLIAPPGKHFASRLPRVAAAFLIMNLALLVGFFRWLTDPHNVVWNPTPRPTFNAVPGQLGSTDRHAA